MATGGVDADQVMDVPRTLEEWRRDCLNLKAVLEQKERERETMREEELRYNKHTADRIEDLEVQVAVLKSEMERSGTAERLQHQEQRERAVKWGRKGKARTYGQAVGMIEELEAEVARLRSELDAEVLHSKRLSARVSECYMQVGEEMDKRFAIAHQYREWKSQHMENTLVHQQEQLDAKAKLLADVKRLEKEKREAKEEVIQVREEKRQMEEERRELLENWEREREERRRAFARCYTGMRRRPILAQEVGVQRRSLAVGPRVVGALRDVEEPEVLELDM